jgi:hypothetical protein
MQRLLYPKKTSSIMICFNPEPDKGSCIDVWVLGSDNPAFDADRPSLGSTEMKKRIMAGRPIVEKFCKQAGVELVGIDVTMEKGDFEPAYFFSDGTGYYTIEGIQNSLKP